jgi:hypothetical protein
MSEGKTINFDAVIAEIGEPLPTTVTLFGQKWKISSAMPVMIPLMAMRLMQEQEKDANLPADADEVYAMSTVLFGEANLKEWLRRGLTVDQLAIVLRETIASFNVTNGDLPNGESRRLKTKKRSTSSPRGVPSRPTSSGSAGSRRR